MSDQSKKIEIPLSAKEPANTAQIFSMPEKFRGLAGKISPPAMKPAVLPPSVLPPPLPKPVLPKPILGKTHAVKKKSRVFWFVGAGLLAVLLGAGLYVFFALRSVEQVVTKPITPAVSKPTVSQPKTEVATEPAEDETDQEKPGQTASPFPNNSQPGRDTDSDGLTDAEEILYKTSSKKPDTDSDGFLDGNEVFHGYDPNAPSPALLSETDFIKTFVKEGNYEVLYPGIWIIRQAAADSVVFVVPSGETISISLEEKGSEVTLTDWFSGTAPASEAVVTPLKTKKGYQALITEDQMTVYIGVKEQVITVSYSNTVKASVDYLATFEMMVNSLSLVD